MRRTRMQCNAHDDMIKCNTQANDMETTTNNRQTPAASNPGRYTMSTEIDDAGWIKSVGPSLTLGLGHMSK